MTALVRRLSWCGAAVLSVSCAAAVLAQGRNDATDPLGSLATLTSELRQLRMAVEESTRAQTQTQALGVYLSVQQSRILQVATRLDSARKELDSAAARSQVITSHLADINDELSRRTAPERRAQLEDANRQFNLEQASGALQEQQARVRESELSQALQVEDSRWADLISRLDQLIKK